MEWNARAQLTTWHPMTSPDGPVAGAARRLGDDLVGINDYARKQWAGLVGGYYAPRADLYLAQALADAAAGRPFDAAAMGRREARLAFEWQTAFGNGYPTAPAGDPVAVSARMRAKWAPFFSACA
jgi:alpha-N-acetylglucosaminidase